MRDADTPIVCITAFDYPTALAVRGAGADMCLVGDSLANVALGYASTRSLTLDASIHHAKAAYAGAHAPALDQDARSPRAPMMVLDMPFGSCTPDVATSVHNVVRAIKETQASAVKIEGSMELVPLVQQLTGMGIDVMGHIGLQPQRFGDASGFRVQGNTAESAAEILRTALALERAGCFSIVMECMPAKVAGAITERLRIPTIGIGAGPYTAGQVLVCSDILGDLESPSHVSAALQALEERGAATSAGDVPEVPAWPAPPRFVRRFAQAPLGLQRILALREFSEAVRARTFPDTQSESYKIKTEEWARWKGLVDAIS